MNRFEHIAHVLKQQTSGFTLSEIAERIDMNAFEDDKNKISASLNNMLNKAHVKKSAGFNNNPARWSMTAQGRAYYSVLNTSNDDETDDQTQPAETDPVSPVSVDHRSESDTETGEEIHVIDAQRAFLLDLVQKPVSEASHTQTPATPVDQLVSDVEVTRAVVAFNNAKKALDSTFTGLINLMLDVASQTTNDITIENKAEALALLERMECNELFNGVHRATFARIRQAVELLEDAE